MSKNDTRFESIFEILPVPAWEEDFSELKSYLIQIGLFGKEEDMIREFFKNNKSELTNCTSKVKIININNACLKLHNASSKKELIDNFPSIFTEESIDTVLEQIICICQEKLSFELTTKTRTLTDEIKDIQFKWCVVPGFEKCLSSIIITTIDVTNHVNTSRKIHENEKKLLEAQSIAKIGNWEIDLLTRDLVCSNEIYRIWEDKNKEIGSNSINFLGSLFPEFIESLESNPDDLMKLKLPLDTVRRLKLKGGIYKWVHIISNIEKDNEEKPVKFTGTVQDITQDENLKQSLRDLIKKYHYVTKATFDAVWDLDLKNNNISWGEGYHNIFGYKLSELNSSREKWIKLIHPVDRLRVSSSLEQATLGSQDNWQEEYRFMKADGQYVIVSDRGLIIRDQKNKPTRIVGAMQNITSRKNSELSILRKTNYLENISRIVESLLIDEDWENVLKNCLGEIGKTVNVDRVYFLKNKKDQTTGYLIARQIYEWCREGISSQIDNQNYQEIPLELYQDFLQKALKKTPYSAITSQTSGHTYKILSEQGIKSILKIPIYFKDTFYGSIGFDDCTTERIWSEEEISFLQTITSNFGVAIEKAAFKDSLRKVNSELNDSNKNLALSNSELEQFAYVASHDLQEPLRMITSFLSLIERKYHDKLDEKGKSYIHFAKDGAKRMRFIILDLLEFSRVGKVGKIENHLFNSNEAVSEVEKLLKTQIVNSEAKIIKNRLPQIVSKESAFQQLIQNLLSNAIKYQKPNIQPIIHIDCEDHKHEWLFSVRDNGLGIAPEYHDKIFVIFQRLHDENEYSGSGIGLAICKKIVDYLGGKIWVQSDIDKGSTFYFTIPKSNYVQ
ncbi:PAS domain-containing protein [Belliella sp. R4-6]|uniref:histidine kinase n=1 Tax=Belliella alkalica TaxID=1730871 RepID=A0ABS9V7B1_9BACT|nr:PAS domain-containing protein [Belliella alkalica]MCH7412258.1 PAS domain-containing protein [Belliella alkalica]